MSTASIAQTLFTLPVAERITLADQLYASVPEDWRKNADDAWLFEAERRSTEMDGDPMTELSEEAFLAGIKRSSKQG